MVARRTWEENNIQYVLVLVRIRISRTLPSLVATKDLGSPAEKKLEAADRELDEMVEVKKKLLLRELVGDSSFIKLFQRIFVVLRTGIRIEDLTGEGSHKLKSK